MEINNVACVGAGLIGHGWATLFAWKAYQVVLQDSREDALERALSKVKRNLEFLARVGLLKAESYEKCLRRIRSTSD